MATNIQHFSAVGHLTALDGNNGVAVLLAQSGLCLVEMISLTFAPRRTGEFFPVCNWSFTDWRDVKP